MTQAVVVDLYGSPDGKLYDPVVAKVERVGVEKARKELGRLAERAGEETTHFAISKYGGTLAMIVPMEDYRRYRQLDGDPTDL